MTFLGGAYIGYKNKRGYGLNWRVSLSKNSKRRPKTRK